MWIKRLKCIGMWWSSIVVALFIAQAIVFTVQAHKGTYTSDPALLEQYMEFASEGKNAVVGDQAPCIFQQVCE